jgi:hypothetical protein
MKVFLFLAIIAFASAEVISFEVAAGTVTAVNSIKKSNAQNLFIN